MAETRVSLALAGSLASLAAFAPISNAWAADTDPITSEDASAIANEADSEIARMRKDLDIVGKGYVAPVPAQVSRVERRLREGEIHYLLGDYLRASIVLLDVVDDETSKTHPKYDECVYLLAESLRKSKNYSGARRHFEEILPRVSGERLKDTVLALLEISSATDHYEDVERYIDRLRSAGTLSRPDVDYIYGKMLFRAAGDDPQKIQRALEVFRSVPAGTQISGQASYYAGVALVRLNRYEDAIRQFTDTMAKASTSKDGAQLRELTALSLGRLYQEVGDVSKSADAYQDIPQSSPYFGDMLYEVAWTHVRAANQAKDAETKRLEFTRALRATELLMATSPSSRLYPQARILEGNLQIRMGASETAYDTFQTIIDRYGSARDKLVDIMQQNAQPKDFFNQLIAADLGDPGSTTILPPVALSWALEEDEMKRAVDMHQDLAESKKFISEAEELVRTLNEALEGEKRYALFPGMRPVRTKAMSVENRLLNVNRRLLNLERRMTRPYVGPTEQAQLDELHSRLAALEEQIQKLPQTEEEVELSKQEIKVQYQEAGRRAHRLTYKVSSMRAQIVATENWINNNRDKLQPSEITLLEQRLVAAANETRVVQEELDKLQSDLRTAEAIAGVDGGSARSRKLRDEYASLVAQEMAALKSMRDRVPAELQGLTARIDQQRAAMQQIDQDLRQLQASLDQQVEGRVTELKAAIATEASRVEKYGAERAELEASTDVMLGPVATRTLNRVGNQFKEFVLQADVGIIDVAWARKQAETKKVTDLIKEQQDRTAELEAEFSDVLTEE